MTAAPEQEEWRPVAGWPGYEVSSLGNLRSFRNTRGRPLATSHPLKPLPSRSGHLQVTLRSPGEYSRPTVHKIVMATFVGPRPEGMEVRHLDGDPTNNALSNLVYGTRSENNLDRVRHGTHNNANKTHCPHGHPYTPENTYKLGGARRGRRCKTCHDRSVAARTARLSAAGAR